MRFRHPLCAVSHAPHSRDAMLSILQWYRIMSPVLSVHVNGVTYDAEKHAAFLDITQVFHIRWSPLKPAPARYVFRFSFTFASLPCRGVGALRCRMRPTHSNTHVHSHLYPGHRNPAACSCISPSAPSPPPPTPPKRST